ncbi:MAG: nucleoside hydrolase [Cyclobacteriaceae bacterium]
MKIMKCFLISLMASVLFIPGVSQDVVPAAASLKKTKVNNPGKHEASTRQEAKQSLKPGLTPKIIFDTDIAEDCDDVGAMAVLHALADKGELEILGMMVSMPVKFGAPALDAINTFYNRPNILVGTLKNSQDSLGAKGLTVYNKDLALRFPNDLKDSSNAPNSVTLYRQLLEREKDTSVVILTVGPLTNLYHLMQSQPDAISSLDGMALIRKKVKRLIIAGGKLPEGSSYNFHLAPDKSEYVINHWPIELWFVPNELGDNVFTGTEMMANTTRENPIHEAYRLYSLAHPGWQFRPSWDQMAVLVAARGGAGLFKMDTTGSVTASKAFIKWNPGLSKNHRWYQNNSSIEQRRKVVEELMMEPPRKQKAESKKRKAGIR